MVHLGLDRGGVVGFAFSDLALAPLPFNGFPFFGTGLRLRGLSASPFAFPWSSFASAFFPLPVQGGLPPLSIVGE